MVTPIKRIATNQAVGKDEKGRFVSGNKPKVGFHTNPEYRSNGRWKKEDSISYQYHMLIRLTINEFNVWKLHNPTHKRTVAQEIAFAAVMESKHNIKYLVEVTDRTEGKKPQTIVNEGESKIIFDDRQIERIAERIAGRKR